MTTRCPNCNYPNPDDRQECFKCATDLTPLEQTLQPPAQPEEASPNPTDLTATPQDTAPGVEIRKPRKPLKTLTLLVCGCFVMIVALWGWNYFSLQSRMNRVLNGDDRNNGVQISVHYGNYVDPSRLIFDLKSISGSNSQMDTFRVFLQFASAMQNKRFEKVELCWRGTPKFFLEGDYFQKLGAEYGSQNPIYTIRTFPENLRHLDGSAAYGQWIGGLLGVLGKQMEDFSDFHHKWYIDEICAQ